MRPTRVRYAVLALLCALSFLTYFDRVCIMRAQGEIQRDLRLGDNQMGLILGAFWLAYALLEIPTGWLGDRFGSRASLARIVLAWSLFTALSGAAAGFASLLACRFCFGVGEAGAFPNMARVQSRWLPERTRARAGGLIWLAARWGGAFSGVILGSVLRAVDSQTFRDAVRRLPAMHALAHAPAWRIGFLLSGLVGLAWCAIFVPFFRDDPADHPAVNDAELRLIRAGNSAASTRTTTHAFPPQLWSRLFASPSLIALGLLYLCGSFGWSFFVSWMPKYLQAVHGVTFQKSEWMTAGPLFFGGITCLLGGVVSDRLVKLTGRRRLARAALPVFGCITAAAAMAGIRLVHTPQQAVALMCVAAAAYDFGQAANWASIVDVGGAYAGTATGLVNTLGNLGNSLQPVVGAAVFHHFGWPALFATYAAFYLAAASMWLVIDPTKTFYNPTPEGRAFEVARATSA